VHLDFHGVEIVRGVRVTRNTLHEAVLVIDQSRCAAPGPGLAMNHHEVAGRRMVEVRSVTANNRGAYRLFNFEDFRCFL
jgi:hypothetical protein